MKKKPKVSVIVPVYNTEPYLRACLDSLINQTLKGIEIICVDDGSTDKSGEILQEYAKIGEMEGLLFKFIIGQKRGVSAARNAGIEAASADFIGFADSDDTLEATVFEKAYAAMTDDVDMVVWNVNVTGDVDENFLAGSRGYHYKNFAGGCSDVCYETILQNKVVVWDKLYRASIIRKYNINFPEGLYREDDEFYYKYIIHCRKYFYIDEVLYNYILRPSSVTVSSESDFVKNKDPKNSLKVWRNIFEHYKEYGLVKPNKALLQALLKLYLELDYYRPVSSQVRAQIRDFAVDLTNEFMECI